MNVSELFYLIPPLGAGIVLGFFYFGSLWLTVQKLPAVRRPVFLSLSSFFARLTVVIAGFYFVMGSRWERLIICLLGFLGVRFVAVRRWGPDRGDHGEGRDWSEAKVRDSKLKAEPNTPL